MPHFSRSYIAAWRIGSNQALCSKKQFGEVPCLRKLIGKVTASLDHTYEELLSLLPGEEVVNVDETGHKEKGRRLWTWCFRADLYTLFRMAKRSLERGEAYFEFITTPNVEPTNNIAEQAIRFVVIDRRHLIR